jgi:hypothetical protein
MGFTTINSYIGLGRESTYGTAVAATSFLEFTEESIKLVAGQTLKGTLRTASPLRTVKNKKSVEGSFKVPVSYGGLEMILKDGLGTVATGGVGPYTHTFTLLNGVPLLPLTMRVKRAAIIANEYVYTGVHIPKLTFSIQPEGQLELSVDVLGRNEDSIGANSSPTYTTTDYVQWDQMTVCTVGGSTINAQSFELTIENPLDGDTHKLGSLLRQLPTRSGHRKISGKFEFEFEDTTHYNYFKNNTENAVVVTFVSSTHSLSFSLPNVIWQGDTPVVDKVGPFKQMMAFEAKATSENNELTITNVNATSSVA